MGDGREERQRQLSMRSTTRSMKSLSSGSRGQHQLRAGCSSSSTSSMRLPSSFRASSSFSRRKHMTRRHAQAEAEAEAEATEKPTQRSVAAEAEAEGEGAVEKKEKFDARAFRRSLNKTGRYV